MTYRKNLKQIVLTSKVIFTLQIDININFYETSIYVNVRSYVSKWVFFECMLCI